MLPITVAGHLCADVIPALAGPARVEPGRLFEVGPLRFDLGGCVANTGVVLAALGAPVTMHGAVGDDELGQVVTRAVAATAGLAGRPQVLVGQTTSYSIVLEPPGQDRTFWHHVGANAVFDGRDVSVEQGVLHVGYPSLLPALLADDATALIDLFTRARAAGVTTSLDLAVVDHAGPAGRLDWNGLLRRILPVTDVVSPSVDDLHSALGDELFPDSGDRADAMARWLLDAGVAVAVVSDGARGLCLRAADERRLRAAGVAFVDNALRWAGAHITRTPLTVPITTTNGAGDASSAGLLYAVAAGFGPQAAADLATATAACTLTGAAATPAAVAALAPALAPLLTAQPPDGPVVVPANQPAARFYAGGDRIAAFRGGPAADPNTPEDWVGSTVDVRGAGPTGQTRRPDGALLADVMAADPQNWLGAAHLDRFGVDPKILVKLLDAGQRLPVHAHPHRDFAASQLGSAHGKAEAWYILSPGEVWLGLTRDVGPEEMLTLVDEQRIDELLAVMHRIPVAAGDRVYVPPGVLHAIGEGVLLTEVQEPEDLSILLEWRGFAIDGAAHGHLGLGFPTALQAVEHHARSAADVTRLIVRADDPAPGLPTPAEEYFRMERVTVGSSGARGEHEIGAGFGILVGVDGELTLTTPTGARTVPSGRTILLPACCGDRRLSGVGTALLVRPPTVRR